MRTNGYFYVWLVLLPCMSLTALGDQEGDFVFRIEGSKAVTTAYVGLGGAVVIPQLLGGKPVAAIGAYTFSYVLNVTNVTIPDSVTQIEEGAFSSCIDLRAVTIGIGTTSIGEGVFANCIRLSNIEVDSLNPAYASVGGVLFNKELTEILAYPADRAGSYTIPTSVITMRSRAFDGCAHLTNVTIPSGVTSIGDATFANCRALTSITIPETVVSLGWSAFAGSGLTTVEVPNSVVSLGDFVFEGCLWMTNATIGRGVIAIKEHAFLYCIKLTAIEVDPLNSAYYSHEGVLFDRARASLLTYPAGKSGSYAIPNDVSSIGDYAFSYCSGLSSIAIPETVATIGAYAFSSCNGLASVTIPKGVISLGSGAFDDCKSLTRFDVDALNPAFSGVDGVLFDKTQALLVKYPTAQPGSYSIPDSVTSIASYAFSGCTELRSITIPGSVINIGTAAFAGCSGLSSLTVPQSIASVADFAFGNCQRLVSVYFQGDRPRAGFVVFAECPFLTVFYRTGTKGWDTTYGGRPTALWEPRPSYSDWVSSSGLAARFPTATGEIDDPDGDGFTNHDEWFAGSDPTQRASRLELELTPRLADLSESDRTPIPAGQRAMYFRSVPGRYYGLQSASSLGSEWELQATRIATPNTTQTRILLPTPDPQAYLQTFYRVVALP